MCIWNEECKFKPLPHKYFLVTSKSHKRCKDTISGNPKICPVTWGLWHLKWFHIPSVTKQHENHPKINRGSVATGSHCPRKCWIKHDGMGLLYETLAQHALRALAPRPLSTQNKRYINILHLVCFNPLTECQCSAFFLKKCSGRQSW